MSGSTLNLERIVPPVLQTLVALAVGVLLGRLFLRQMPLAITNNLRFTQPTMTADECEGIAYLSHMGNVIFVIFGYTRLVWSPMRLSHKVLTWIFIRVLLQDLHDVTAAVVSDALS